jgi:transposase
MGKDSTICAGIDTGKRKLDVTVDGSTEVTKLANTAKGHAELVIWLRERGVTRVGIEATGGYERDVVAELRAAGFEVIVFQPGQVRAYARFRLRRAKNDKIDADVVAECTAAMKGAHAPPDPRLASFADHLTMIDQISKDIACCKNRLESCRDEHIRRHWKAEITRLERVKKDELKRLVAAIRQHADLAKRLELIESVDGVGTPTAVAILVRMPEIGQIGHEQAAALAGLAPFDHDSGQHRGKRQIAGGRRRLRGALFMAAFSASSCGWNQALKGMYQRLVKAGKEHKVAVVACARKLLIYVNTVVARGTAWSATPLTA